MNHVMLTRAQLRQHLGELLGKMMALAERAKLPPSEWVRAFLDEPMTLPPALAALPDSKELQKRFTELEHRSLPPSGMDLAREIARELIESSPLGARSLGAKKMSKPPRAGTLGEEMLGDTSDSDFELGLDGGVELESAGPPDEDMAMAGPDDMPPPPPPPPSPPMAAAPAPPAPAPAPPRPERRWFTAGIQGQAITEPLVIS